MKRLKDLFWIAVSIPMVACIYMWEAIKGKEQSEDYED